MQVLSSDIQYLQHAKTIEDTRGTEITTTDSSSVPAHSTSDTVEISNSAKEKQSKDNDNTTDSTSSSQNELSEDDQKKVEELKERDQEVRTHEQAHVAAGGQHVTGGPTYEFEQGPDGKRYATGGHVNIDTSEVPDDPQATIEKAQVIKRAALAPAEPSDADRSVASAATQMEQKVRQELTEQQNDQKNESSSNKINKPHPYASAATASSGTLMDVSS